MHVELGDDGEVSVIKIEEGSPAYWSDLRVGDCITHVQVIHTMCVLHLYRIFFGLASYCICTAW